MNNIDDRTQDSPSVGILFEIIYYSAESLKNL